MEAKMAPVVAAPAGNMGLSAKARADTRGGRRTITGLGELDSLLGLEGSLDTLATSVSAQFRRLRIHEPQSMERLTFAPLLAAALTLTCAAAAAAVAAAAASVLAGTAATNDAATRMRRVLRYFILNEWVGFCSRNRRAQLSGLGREYVSHILISDWFDERTTLA
jgi:hypothetical protein